MTDGQLYHALNIDENTCFGCTHCMNVCPTGAIRIKDGKASIRADWCIDCGDCLNACPVDAIYVEQDDFEKILRFKYRVALVPSVMIGQFPEHVSEEQIFGVMRELGFTHVFQAEHTVQMINDIIVEQQQLKEVKPLISSFCPAVVRLIQIKFPSLVENIVKVKAPIDASAAYYKKKLVVDEGFQAEDIGIFYVTPCAAKIAAVKDQSGGKDYSVVDGVINMSFLYNKVYHIIKNQKKVEEIELPVLPHLSSKAMKWGLTNGEADNMFGRCLAIDGIHNAIEFLEKLENDEVSEIDFVEFRACDQSCAGGVLVTGNRFLTVERLRKRAKSLDDSSVRLPSTEKHKLYVADNVYLKSIKPLSVMRLDEDMLVALKKMERVRHMMCFLPGIDCGACGAPNCESLAEDIVQKDAQLSNCVFLQRMMEKSRKLSSEHAIRIIEKTWGKDRLDKDCYKKGAKNEGM